MAAYHFKATSSSPEVTWSIMHPVRPYSGYMREVIAAAASYHVDSFEVCGDVHGSGGGLDGAILFRDYAVAAGGVDPTTVAQNVARLQKIIELAHDSGRPMYYWHREVMVPQSVVEQIPGLLDENGEFNLMGEAYQSLIRSKIREFFEQVPAMDGLVLTLTESDYSVIHNSDQQRYPSQEVVARVVGAFAEELQARGKRFILRSFGSIAQDYEDILRGAEMVAERFSFEIETKITPYDFSPFLPFNPYLRKSGACSLSAEYDSIGEFLGAGFLPAPDPERVIESVNHARQQGVDRHVIRIDRIGHAAFLSTQSVNLLAFDRAIRDPNVKADAIWTEWADAHWPDCPEAMVAVMRQGIAMTKGTHFIDGHVIFHAFPIQPDLKWLKACGIFSVFRPRQPLDEHVGMWGILTNRVTPARETLLREKHEAVALADEALRTLELLKGKLSQPEFQLAKTAWRNAAQVTRAIYHWCRGVCAYFNDMEAGRPDHPTLDQAIVAARAEFETMLGVRLTKGGGASRAAPGVTAHEYGGGSEPEEDCIEDAYIQPIWRLLVQLPDEYEGEFRERMYWAMRGEVQDCIVCGGLLDDLRVHRYMHASHARLIAGRPARAAGNRVFPNGFIDVRLALPAGEACRLIVRGEAGPRREFQITVEEENHVVRFSAQGEYVRVLTRSAGPRRAAETVRVRIQKVGSDFPLIYAIATLSGSGQPSHHPLYD
ncbi:MAG: hypothetical protein PSV13_07610 [Lacunisphaera sp.]|nr:hypothetical protein [Lacunisphaera sp.]